MAALIIKTIDNRYSQQVVDLILPIQQIEFQVPVTLADQPDLQDIDNFYITPGGGFWGAFEGDMLVGTIALIATGHNAGAIRKMFVRKEYRGRETGVAQQLLDKLIQYSHQQHINDLYLGTVDILKAALRFYERNGFNVVSKKDLPSYFPVMSADNVFYHRHLL